MYPDSLLTITNLSVSIKDTTILNKLNFIVRCGEVHTIMGPNGSGKSSLTRVLVRDDRYKVSEGMVTFSDTNLLNLTTEQCSLLGIFLAFQHPVSIPGVLNLHFLKNIYDIHLKNKGCTSISNSEFLNLIRKHMFDLKMSDDFLYRNLNVGFSGGEKKKNEILQMALIKPRLLILDEVDSGLDVDSLKLITDKINSMRYEGQSIIVITHYPRILNYIKTDFVHVLSKGSIINTGNYKLALDIEKYGYV